MSTTLPNHGLSEATNSYFTRRINDKLDAVDEVSSKSAEQTKEIVDQTKQSTQEFVDHMVRQVDLVDSIRDSLVHLKTTVDEVIHREISKLSKKRN